MQEGIEEVLGAGPGRAEIRVEYMDSKRHSGPAWRASLEAWLGAEFRSQAPDLILACDDPALGFLVATRDRLFPQVPVVFCGVNDFSPGLLGGRKGITGIVEEPQYSATLALARSLFPRAGIVYVAADQSESGRAMLREFRAQLARDLPSLAMVEVPVLGLEALSAWLAALPRDGLVFMLNYLVDGEGRVHAPDEVATALSASGLPVFTGHDAFLAPGILGGRCVTGVGQGRAAADLALHILGGGDPSAPPRVSAEANTWIFSWADLRRHGLSARDLPKETRFEGRPATIFATNPRMAIFFLASIVLLVLFSTFLGILVRILRRDKARLAIEERRYRALFESLAFGFAQHEIIKDSWGKAVDYRFLEVNGLFETLIGFSRDIVIGKTATEVYGSALFLEDYALVAAGGGLSSRDLPFKDRIYRTTAYCPYPGQFVTLFEDATDFILAQERIRESENRFRRLFDTMEQGVIYQDWEGKIVSANASACRILGVDPSVILGYRSFDLRWDSIRPDGSPFPADEIPAMAALGSGRRETAILGILNPRLGSRVWIVATAVPEFEAGESKPKRIFVTFTDITPLKQAEDRLALQARELARKNEELERFAYKVSHDLKSPLVTIKGFLAFVEKDLGAGDRERMTQDLGRIGQAADRMQDLLGDILELSRIGRSSNRIETFPLASALDLALDNLAGGIVASGAGIEKPLAWPEVTADRLRISEVFQNLLENALKYHGGKPPHIVLGWKAEGGEYRIFVQDSGIGLEAKYLSTVFGLFNKLDPKSEGTGVGLALVQRIVELHGGRAWVESPGRGSGSTFWFSLPLAPRAEGAQP